MITDDLAIPASLGWWAGLQPDPVTGRPGDPGALARLRRCPDGVVACSQPATADLARRIGGVQPSDYALVGTLAALLSHLRRDQRGESLPRLLGLQDGGSTVLAPSRWEALIAAPTADERAQAARRALGRIDYAAPLPDLVRLLVGWNDRRRAHWSYAYWNAGSPAAADPAP